MQHDQGQTTTIKTYNLPGLQPWLLDISELVFEILNLMGKERNFFKQGF